MAAELWRGRPGHHALHGGSPVAGDAEPDDAAQLHGVADDVVPVLRLTVRVGRRIRQLAGGRRGAARLVRVALLTVHDGWRPERVRLQLQAVPVEPRYALGVSPGFEAVPGVGAGA